jgi:hypothetical protein
MSESDCTVEFLSLKQISSLEKAIAKARAAPGIHCEPVENGGEALAFRFLDEINWAISSGLGIVVARGMVPLPHAGN